MTRNAPELPYLGELFDHLEETVEKLLGSVEHNLSQVTPSAEPVMPVSVVRPESEPQRYALVGSEGQTE